MMSHYFWDDVGVWFTGLGARLRPMLTTAALVLVGAYFVVQGLIGDKGLLLENARSQTLASLKAELQNQESQTRDYQSRVKNLQDQTLSADLLDERARAILGFSDPKDYVIRIKSAAN